MLQPFTIYARRLIWFERQEDMRTWEEVREGRAASHRQPANRSLSVKWKPLNSSNHCCDALYVSIIFWRWNFFIENNNSETVLKPFSDSKQYNNPCVKFSSFPAGVHEVTVAGTCNAISPYFVAKNLTRRNSRDLHFSSPLQFWNHEIRQTLQIFSIFNSQKVYTVQWSLSWKRCSRAFPVFYVSLTGICTVKDHGNRFAAGRYRVMVRQWLWL